MIETAVFSIFHRGPARPAVTSPDPVYPASQPLPIATSRGASAPVSPPSGPELDRHVQSADELLAGQGVNLPEELTCEPQPLGSATSTLEASFVGEGAVLDIVLEHELLGLANPEVFSLSASFDGETRIQLTAERSGIYRPKGFRAAPWSGFAYDQVPDGLTGLGAGTRLLTSRGEVPVEGLLPGDSVLALRGPALLPITWVGRSAAKEPPVLIEQGALGPNRPRRALFLAPDHPVFIDPMPVPARQLVNGTTIRTAAAAEAELFHVDVGSAEVLFAEGIPLSSANRYQAAAT